jgi:hypothetical protein
VARNFTARIESVGPGASAAWVSLALPKHVSDALPSRGNVPVTGTIDGFPFRTSALPDGKGGHGIVVNRAKRDGAGVGPGDRVAVVLEVDTASREPTVPADLRRAVRASAKARPLWADLTPRCRAEWVAHVEEAKKPETRARRIATMIERLASGTRRFYDG